MMIALPSTRSLRIFAAFAMAGMLAACQSAPVANGLPQPQAPAETTGLAGSTLPPAAGEILGQGPVRVAMLLPLSGQGTSAQVGREFRNAAALAMEDVGADTMQLVIKDTGSDPAQLQATASQSVTEGSSLVLGPIFSADVAAASAITRPAGKTLIAFSSDRNVAGNHVYLNSFLPGPVVDRVVAYAAQQNIRSVVGFFAAGAAGDIAERAARDSLATHGGRLALSVRYQSNEASIQQAAAAAASSLATADGLLIPEGGAIPSAIVAALRSNGADLTGKRLLGTGQWTTANLSDPALVGGWFADSDQQRLSSFKTRYQSRFGMQPSANAALAYDTVVMAGSNIKRYGAGGLSSSVLEADAGYAGYAGIFRFERDGTTDRGYAVFEVQPGGGTRVVSPSPGSFAAGS